jgi:3'5'-cyclic nucleotide phosphodiesterase
MKNEANEVATTGPGATGSFNNNSNDISFEGDTLPCGSPNGLSDSSKMQRLIEWNTDTLRRLLKQIVAHRTSLPSERGTKSYLAAIDREGVRMARGRTALEEVKEIISLPKYDPTSVKRLQDPETVKLSNAVESQLEHYVQTIAQMYYNNPFHNFEHASHVAMSVTKLLSRIVAPVLDDHEVIKSSNEIALKMHDHTYGITSDPLTQFAVVFSALIHDVDHSGVPNAQLVKENAKIAGMYHNKSVAEQNSVDLSWGLLMDPNYSALRAAIYSNEEELRRFRQLVVNTVLATDIVDTELKELRNGRWAKAFYEATVSSEKENGVDRKATIVIEHLIQASDVAHTMQHWHVYRKWNERFFIECYRAYKAGRSNVDPAENWYKGEIGFFDFYIIPLAKKLKDCGVFGVSSEEYLSYAMVNRKEWEEKGQEVVEEMIRTVLRLGIDGDITS